MMIRAMTLCLVGAALLAFSPARGHAQDPLSRELTTAIRRNQVAEVDRLLAAGARVEASHFRLAVNRAGPEMVRLLVRHGTDPDIVDDAFPVKLTALMDAVSRDPEAVRLLLELGADPNMQTGPGGMTPLMYAAAEGNLESVELLLAFGADPSIETASGRTALSLATLKAIATRDNRVVERLDDGSGMSAQALALITRGYDVDGTHQEGAHTLDENRTLYTPGAFTGPCSARRVPLMDPPEPKPGEGGSTHYRSTSVVSVPGPAIGTVRPPDCEPLHLTDGRYHVTVLGGDLAWTWECSEHWSRCQYVARKELSKSLVFYSFDITVSSDAPEVPEDECDDASLDLQPSADVRGPWSGADPSASLRIDAPAADENFSFDRRRRGRVEIQLQATAEPAECEGEIRWEADDIDGSTKTFDGQTGPGRGASVTLAYENLPASNDAFGPKTIRASFRGQRDSVQVLIFFDPGATNHPLRHPTIPGRYGIDVPNGRVPNWFYYWSQGAVPNLERFRYKRTATYGYGEFDPKTGLLEVGPKAWIDFQQVVIPLHRIGTCTPSWSAVVVAPTDSIASVARIVAHELKHEELYLAARGNDTTLAPGETLRTRDEDEDGVPSTLDGYAPPFCILETEILNALQRDGGYTFPSTNARNTQAVQAIHLNVTGAAAAAAQQKLNQIGDNELLAQAAERSAVFDRSKDWSKCGRHWTKQGC